MIGYTMETGFGRKTRQSAFGIPVFRAIGEEVGEVVPGLFDFRVRLLRFNGCGNKPAILFGELGDRDVHDAAVGAPERYFGFVRVDESALQGAAVGRSPVPGGMGLGPLCS